jgi:hypothetical protein
MTNIQDVKILALNAATFLLSFSNIETVLKIMLLLISIGYTATKWYELYKNKNKSNDEV